MRRPVFSFRPNMENPEHKQAWEILKSVPDGQKNQYLVQAILKLQDAEYMETVIRKVVREEFGNISIVQEEPMEKEEIPNQMLDFLFQMEEGL